jgi:hypothetical protein
VKLNSPVQKLDEILYKSWTRCRPDGTRQRLAVLSGLVLLLWSRSASLASGTWRNMQYRASLIGASRRKCGLSGSGGRIADFFQSFPR